MNNLIKEDSPYLRQHAQNPVWWQPWCDEAFQKAREKNKLIFLSIGYSTCHWCHVMERESFEDETIGEQLNKNFVSIKVDREEMPHVDKYYQDVHYLLQRRGGGWPLTIIMLPNREVIFAATYLPKSSRNGMMGLGELLQFLHKKTIESPDEVSKSAKSITEAIGRMQNLRTPPKPIESGILDDFVQNIANSFDEKYKGIGDAPKFPHASTFTALIEIGQMSKNNEALKMAHDAYTAMAMGGIYDQIEGGFYRYSVDERWEIPHFEKMLYTNAELLTGYARLYANSPKSLYKETIEGIVGAMNERFLQDGLYVSASDADSEGEEGKYFVFKYKEARKALLEAGFDVTNVKELLQFWQITPGGNFENSTSNPYRSLEIAPPNVAKAKKALQKLRSKVAFPFIDTKVLTSWNGLMIVGLFEAGEWVNRVYRDLGFKVLDRLLESLHVKDVLYHQWLRGSSLRVVGLLEDYAFLSEALIYAYTISGKEDYLAMARKLAFKAKEQFYRNGTWYLSADGFEAKAPLEDASYKSASATMMHVLLKLALIDGDLSLKDEVENMLRLVSGAIAKHPHAYPEMLRVCGAFLSDMVALHVKSDLREKACYQTSQNPRILVITSKENEAKACTFGNCFAQGELENVLLQIP
jgi:hypothetical protein